MWKGLSLHPTETQITLGLKTATLIVVTLILFSQDLTILFNDALQSETTSYTLAIPLIFVYLIYRKRKMLRAVTPSHAQDRLRETKHLPTLVGTLLSIIAILLYWYGSYTFTPLEYHMLSLPIFMAGISLILFNPQTLQQLAFPLVFLIFLTPPPSEILYALGATLSIISAEASNTIINLFGIQSTLLSEYGNPTIQITSLDGTPISFAVDIACSGVYSLIGFLIFATFIAYITRDKPWKKLTLFLIGLPLIYLLNIVRITTILLIGYHYGEDLAIQTFHLLGGWVLIFLGTLLLLTISEKAFKTRILDKPSKKCPNCNPAPKLDQSFCFVCGRILSRASNKLHKIDIIKIMAVITSAILIMYIQVPVFAFIQGPPIVTVDTPAGQQLSTEILPQIPNYNLEFLYRDTRFEARAKQDLAMLYFYNPINRSEEPVWVAIEIASTLSSLHRWETCLITWQISKGYQPKVTQVDLKDVQLTQNPPIIGRFFVFQAKTTEVMQAVLYWYETATFRANSTTQNKHIKISLIAFPDNFEDLAKVETKLQALANTIANYSQSIKTWSQAALLISQNGINLAAISSALLLSIMVLYYLKTRKEKKANANAYQKLSKPNKDLIDTVHRTQETTTPTLNAIATKYQSTTGQTIPKENLLKKLLEAEKIGIIKSSVANEQDEPIQIWKTQIPFNKT